MTVNFHVLPSINQQTSTSEDVEKGNPSALLVGMQTGAATVENSMEFPQKLKNETAFWPRDSTAGYVSKETQNTNSEEYMQPCVHCSNIVTAKIWKQPKCPSLDEWVKKLGYIYTIDYNAAIKKKELLPFATAWMDLGIIMLRKTNQLEKEYHIISLVREVYSGSIQPCNLKNRDIYWRRYKIQEILCIRQWCLSPLQSRHLGTSHSSPICHQLPHPSFLNLIDGLKSLTFQRWF